MERMKPHQPQAKMPGLWIDKGRIWFSRDAERKFYFVLALVAFFTGLAYKLGLLQ